MPLGHPLLEANRASVVTVVQEQKRTSGSNIGYQIRIQTNTPASAERLRGKCRLRYDPASDSPVAAREAEQGDYRASEGTEVPKESVSY